MAGAGADSAGTAAAAAAAVHIPFGRLVWWSTVPVLKVLLLGLGGVALARRVSV